MGRHTGLPFGPKSAVMDMGRGGCVTRQPPPYPCVTQARFPTHGCTSWLRSCRGWAGTRGVEGMGVPGPSLAEPHRPSAALLTHTKHPRAMGTRRKG